MIATMPGETAAPEKPAPAAADQPSPLLLSYGRAPSRLRRWLRRLFFAAWFAGFCWLAYDKWGVQARLLGLLIYRQHECLVHTEPADRVVIDLDPLRARALAAQKNYKLFFSNPNRGGLFGGSQVNPNIFAAMYGALDEPHQQLMDARAMWKSYDELLHPPPTQPDLQRVYDIVDTDPFNVPDFSSKGGDTTQRSSDAGVVVFMHERGTADKPSRLVIVWGGWYSTLNGVELEAEVYETSHFGMGRQLSGSTTNTRGTALRVRSPDKSPSFRLFAGQPDPKDASRFTIRYESSRGNGTIEGRITADESVMLRVLDGPVTSGF